MQTIRAWMLTIALSALAGGIVWLLTPKGSVQKAVRTVVAVFLLCAFLSPLLNRQGIDFAFLLPEEAAAPTIPGFDETVSRQLQSAVEQELTRRIFSVLEEQKISGQILVRTDILPDGGINIATAKVALPAGTNTSGLKKRLAEAAGTEVEISVG